MPTTTEGIAWKHAEVTALEVRVCPTCGITYAGPMRFFENRRQTGGGWWCPNGHSLSFTKTEAERLREKVEAEKRNTNFWRERSQTARKEAEHEAARANGYKGALTKVKKRVGNGVCPCCNRTFKDLARHMESQHPGFKGPVEEAVSVP